MDKSGAAVAQFGGLRAVSRYQWLVFLVVWLGWTLDAADFGLYSLVLRPAMTELLGGNPPFADIGKYGGLLAMAGLLGWAFGGFLFGIIADYIGRVRTLAFSIAIYSRVHRAAGALGRDPRLRPLPLHRRARHRRRADGRHPTSRRDIGRDTSGENRRLHDDRRRGGYLCWRLGLRPRRRLWLAVRVFHRHRAGDPACLDPAAGCSSPIVSPMCRSAAASSPPACAAARATASSCASCRFSCSPRRTATTRWSACCLASARCWRSGPQ